MSLKHNAILLVWVSETSIERAPFCLVPSEQIHEAIEQTVGEFDQGVEYLN